MPTLRWAIDDAQEDKSLKVVQVGLGPIGLSLIECARAQGHEIVGAVDADPGKVGRDIRDFLGDGAGSVKIVPHIRDVAEQANVVLHATGSRLGNVAEQIRACVEQHLNIVSTCEELFYPWRQEPDLAEQLHIAAKNAGVTVVGTGVNPGFAMDVLPLVATIPCWSVRAVRVKRTVDALTRRQPLQKKVGIGLSPGEFEARARTGEIGHVGLADSAWMICDRLGLQGRAIKEEIHPVIATSAFERGDLVVRPGNVLGLHQTATVESSAGDVVRLELEMFGGAENPQDDIAIEGDPPVRIFAPNGLPGDASTAGVVVNTARRAIEAQPGLLSVADLPLPYPSPIG
jgi:hypothetical protein